MSDSPSAHIAQAVGVDGQRCIAVVAGPTVAVRLGHPAADAPWRTAPLKGAGRAVVVWAVGVGAAAFRVATANDAKYIDIFDVSPAGDVTPAATIGPFEKRFVSLDLQVHTAQDPPSAAATKATSTLTEDQQEGLYASVSLLIADKFGYLTRVDLGPQRSIPFALPPHDLALSNDADIDSQAAAVLSSDDVSGEEEKGDVDSAIVVSARGAVLLQHQSVISAVAATARHLITADRDGNLRASDALMPALIEGYLWRPPGHPQSMVTALATTVDPHTSAEVLLCGTASGDVTVWDLQSEELDGSAAFRGSIAVTGDASAPSAAPSSVIAVLPFGADTAVVACDNEPAVTVINTASGSCGVVGSVSLPFAPVAAAAVAGDVSLLLLRDGSVVTVDSDGTSAVLSGPPLVSAVAAVGELSTVDIDAWWCSRRFGPKKDTLEA